MENSTAKVPAGNDNLDRARTLELPSREAMLNRAPSVTNFWSQNKQVLRDAWCEWEESRENKLLIPDDSLLNSDLKKAIESAWNNPIAEDLVKELWEEVSPGVFQCQFFDPSRLVELRTYLDAVQSANIPIRPPHGIALNRFGAMLDKRSEGYLAAPRFQDFYNQLLDKYMRPVARLLFPEIYGYDTQTFGFSIQYEPGVDTSLQPHTDASAATLNINLNMPGESFGGSEVDFYDTDSGKVNRLTFEPGTAMLHSGLIPHAARPITSGKRTNFVLWLYGDRMQLPSPDAPRATPVTAQDRWTTPLDTKDNFAPF